MSAAARPEPRPLAVSGVVPLTTIDYPDHLACVVFCQGCPWRCSYCHNPHLLPARGENTRDWDTVRAFLESRRGLLDAVVFSGGEPTFQPGLAPAIDDARALGFRVGLHTGGAYPDRLAALLPQTDWIGLDVKTAFEAYDALTGAPGSGERARASLVHVLASDCEYEIRTTLYPGLAPDTLLRLAEALANQGVTHYVVQAYRPPPGQTGADAAWMPGPDDPVVQRLQQLFPHFTLRSMD